MKILTSNTSAKPKKIQHPYADDREWHTDNFKVEVWEDGKEINYVYPSTLESAQEWRDKYLAMHPRASIVIRETHWRVVETA